MQAPSIVDTESFQTMVRELSRNSVTSPTSQQIQLAIGTNIYSIRSFIAARLKEIEFICVTADLWGQGDQNYVGITGHFISPSRFVRESFALGFRKVEVLHKTAVAKEIKEVLKRFHIEKKVQDIVTGNVFSSTFNDFSEVGIRSHFQSFSCLLKSVMTEDVMRPTCEEENYLKVRFESPEISSERNVT